MKLPILAVLAKLPSIHFQDGRSFPLVSSECGRTPPTIETIALHLHLQERQACLVGGSPGVVEPQHVAGGDLGTERRRQQVGRVVLWRAQQQLGSRLALQHLPHGKRLTHRPSLSQTHSQTDALKS